LVTSGTTGQPKAWIKTYRSWAAVINHNLHHFDTPAGTRMPRLSEGIRSRGITGLTPDAVGIGCCEHPTG
jgi:acyl-CoA synthetase (AMP-forming)/AMP-acid ligase II